MIECRCPPGDCAGLVRRYLEGDRAAGDELVRQFTPLVRGTVRHILGPSRRDEWDDACQIVFLRLFGRLATWRQQAPFCHWLAVVATRRAIDCLELHEPHLPLPDAEAAPVTGDVLRCIQEAAARWPAERRSLLDLLVEGVGREEMAGRLGVSLRTLHYRIAAIREDLLKCLDDE